jgi:inositol phosphorylceramide mannosyltransferase catalytic subunit
MSMIPKKIHQTARSFESLAPEVKESISRLRETNPDWEHKFYDDADVMRYLEKHLSNADFAEVKKLNPKYGVILADLFRYLVVYHEGGIYLDTKSTATRPLNEVLKPVRNFLISQWRNRLGERYQGFGCHAELSRIPGGEFQQWHVAAQAKHPFLKAVVDQTLYNIKTYSPARFGIGRNGVLRVSGPICYTRAIRPLLEHFPVTFADAAGLGLQYTIYEGQDDAEFHARNPEHYSNLKEPIVVRAQNDNFEDTDTDSLGEILANVVRNNIELVLKVALFSMVFTTIVLFVLIALIFWRAIF